MTDRLLDRQSRLLEYLASGAAIFGDRVDALQNHAPPGVDPALLHLEASFCHEKRMAKIAIVFPTTIELLGSERDMIMREFAETYPSTDITRLANARQFHGFLFHRRRRDLPEVPYLLDVAACELARAQVRTDAERGDPDYGRDQTWPCRGVRRSPSLVLLRCAYDVRPIFEHGAKEVPTTKRDTRLVVVMPPGAEQPVVLEVPAGVFDLLTALDNWVDQATFGNPLEAEALIDELHKLGLVEVRR
jgi:hypothetical protein